MSQYVDGFIIPIKKKNLSQYKKMAKYGLDTWMKHGALMYYECVGDDFLEHGISVKKLCNLKPDETAIFAFIVFKSKAHRDRVNKKVFSEKENPFINKPMPFDMKRFSMLGCKTLVHSK